jgi:hypothetical protein
VFSGTAGIELYTSNGSVINYGDSSGYGGSFVSRSTANSELSLYSNTNGFSYIASVANKANSASFGNIFFVSNSPVTSYFQIGTTGIHIPNNGNGGNVFASGTVYTTDLAVSDSNITLNNGALYIGKGASTGTSNLIIGENVPSNTVFGSNGLNTIYGNTAGKNMSPEARDCTLIGYSAGSGITTGGWNTFIGSIAGFQTSGGTGAINTCIGAAAGSSMTTSATANTLIGANSGDSITTGYRNTCLGQTAGRSITTGDNNTCIGYGTNVSSGNLTFASAIGAGASVSTSNTIQLGRSSDNVNCPNTLSVASTSTFSGLLSAPGGISGSTANFSGIITATTGVTAGTITAGLVTATSIYGATANFSGIITATTGVTAGTITAGLVTATSIYGATANFSGIITATTGVTAGTITASRIYGATANFSGIITATTGVTAGTITAGTVYSSTATIINQSSVQNTGSFTVSDNSGNSMYVVANSTSGGNNPIVQTGGSVICGNPSLTLTTNSNTSSGVIITTTSTTIGAGGTWGSGNPTSRAVFNSTTGIELYSSSGSLINYGGGGVNSWGGYFISRSSNGSEFSMHSNTNGNSYIDSSKNRNEVSSWADIIFRSNPLGAGGTPTGGNATTQFIIGDTGIHIPNNANSGGNVIADGNVFADGSVYSSGIAITKVVNDNTIITRNTGVLNILTPSYTGGLINILAQNGRGFQITTSGVHLNYPSNEPYTYFFNCNNQNIINAYYIKAAQHSWRDVANLTGNSVYGSYAQSSVQYNFWEAGSNSGRNQWTIRNSSGIEQLVLELSATQTQSECGLNVYNNGTNKGIDVSGTIYVGSTATFGSTISVGSTATFSGVVNISTNLGGTSDSSFVIKDSSNNNSIEFLPKLGDNGYNNIVDNNDSVILAKGTSGTSSTGVLTLTTWSATKSGVRIAPSSVAIMAGSASITLNGSSNTITFDSPSTFNSTVTATSFNASSDYRIKENVVPLSTNYSVDNLNPVHYYNKSSKKEDIGFIAHEVQEEFPCLVTGEKDGAETQSLNYNGLIPILVKEIKELKERVKFLEEQIKK